jgi:glycosyltransferase involved in cell wall biosynthesis
MTLGNDPRKHIALYFGVFEDERVGLWTFSCVLLRALLEQESALARTSRAEVHEEATQHFCFWVFASAPTRAIAELEQLAEHFPKFLRVIDIGLAWVPRKLQLLLELRRRFRHFDVVHATANFCAPFVKPPLVLHLHDAFQAFEPSGPDTIKAPSIRNHLYRLLLQHLVRRARTTLTDLPLIAQQVQNYFEPQRPVLSLPAPLAAPHGIQLDARESRRGIVLFCSRDERKWLRRYFLDLSPEVLQDTTIILIAAQASMTDALVSLFAQRKIQYELQIGLGREELLRTIGQAQALVFPSIAEGFGYPVYEALMMGTPVLCRPEMTWDELRSGAADLLVLLNDNQQTSIDAATKRLLECNPSAERRREVSGFVQDLLSPQRFARQLRELYQKCVAAF